MTGISFVIVTSGNNDDSINQIIDTIEHNNIPEYEVILVGGLTSTIKRNNTIHIPFDESMMPTVWLTRKKNTGVFSSRYEVCVIG